MTSQWKTITKAPRIRVYDQEWRVRLIKEIIFICLNISPFSDQGDYETLAEIQKGDVFADGK
jgi:hypothetical protein